MIKLTCVWGLVSSPRNPEVFGFNETNPFPEKIERVLLRLETLQERPFDS